MTKFPAFITALCTSFLQLPVGVPTGPLSYPWNASAPGWFQEEIKLADSIFLGRFVKRERISREFTYRTNGYSDPILWVDTFERLSDEGSKGALENQRVLTFEFGEGSKSPAVGATYMIAVMKPLRGDARLYFTPGSSGPLFRIRASSDAVEVGGLICVSASEVLRARDPLGKEDLRGTMLLTLTRSLGSFDSAQQVKAVVERIRAMNLIELIRRRKSGGPDFDFAIAGEDSERWIEARMTPILKDSLSKLKGDNQRADALALLTIMPGGESHGREMFELLKRLARQQRWNLAPYNCRISVVPASERMQAAREFPGHPREFFFPYPDVAGLAAKDRPPPADEATIRTIISWLPTARPTFAIQLLRLLSSWADRSQMSPDLKLNPKVSTGPWKNGEPVVENLEFLIKLWRENPPPIRRSGS